ncbi:hypothetical protein [Nocardiopsis composta]|uniref:Class I SAM-dependent methyltransferase n=1 Tax=Nocardiopsis composta TaxID=157465 RepID=A0A7W8VGR3_9ACTN|nr:hypothetical protein [Nocardiopsis composta]MBB5435219.1 hypothetical protein [Nocardiopsis composta]
MAHTTTTTTTRSQGTPPLAVWTCGQHEHIPPREILTRRAVLAFSARGDEVVLLGHGDGAVLLQTASAGRTAWGIEVEANRSRRAEEWLRDLPDNLRGRAHHRAGDARRAAELLGEVAGRARLVLAWLPDPAPTAGHAQDRAAGHLGRLSGADYERAAGELIGAAATLAAPGAAVVLVCAGRPQAGGADRVLIASRYAPEAGLAYLQHIIAITARLNNEVDEGAVLGVADQADNGAVPGAPDEPVGIGRARAQAVATVVHPAHDDVVVLTKPADRGAGVGR